MNLGISLAQFRENKYSGDASVLDHKVYILAGKTSGQLLLQQSIRSGLKCIDGRSA